MISVFFVMDGERDHVTVPPLVMRLLGINIQVNTIHWRRLHQPGLTKGYQRKLRFAIEEARLQRAAALIAVVDRDKASRQEKIKELRTARDACVGLLPVALGQADPHGEAWLLDDPLAICRGLRLPLDTDIPTVRRVSSPKDTIEELRRESERSGDPILEVLADITAEVRPSRCRHGNETGFEEFAEDVRHQLGPVARQCGEECKCGGECRQSE